MSDSILKKLASKLSAAEPKAGSGEDAAYFEEVLDEHFDAVAAALAHTSNHVSSHSSTPFTFEP